MIHVESCKVCRFYFPNDDPSQARGVCCRFPGTVVASERTVSADGKVSVQTFTSFPTMLDSGWCGEYQQRDEKDQAQ